MDVDGVLNSEASREGGDHMPAADLMRNLSQVVDATGVQIVLSSTWRLEGPSKRAIELALGRQGLRVLSSTADLKIFGDRVDEILGWMADHTEYDVSAWIAVDDMDLVRMNPKLDSAHFVTTCDSVGLSSEKVEEAVGKLTAQEERTAHSAPGHTARHSGSETHSHRRRLRHDSGGSRHGAHSGRILQVTPCSTRGGSSPRCPELAETRGGDTHGVEWVAAAPAGAAGEGGGC